MNKYFDHPVAMVVSKQARTQEGQVTVPSALKFD
jgi:hypothetical protein